MVVSKAFFSFSVVPHDDAHAGVLVPVGVCDSRFETGASRRSEFNG
jgi:hypothetical protein